MKMFVEPADIYLYMDIVDFRKSINGLIDSLDQGYQAAINSIPETTTALRN
jgi:hypothetical protein